MFIGHLRDAAVDHFVPWARYQDNGIDNLVLADGSCNGAKGAFLAAPEHVARWVERNWVRSADLRAIAARVRWDAHPEVTRSVARALYTRLPRGAKLWRRAKEFVDLEPGDIARLLAAG